MHAVDEPSLNHALVKMLRSIKTVKLAICPPSNFALLGLLPALAYLLLFLLVCGSTTHAQTNVVTQHYDNFRSGANTNETILTPANVNTATFGKLFSNPVDGYVFAQPLYLQGVTMGPGTAQPGTTHNVVFIATEHDSVYAFDADANTGANAAPLWQITLLDAAHGAAAGATTMPPSDVSNDVLGPEIGITGTPVIDSASGTLYVVGVTKENGTYIHRLHALDITTGAEKVSFNSPMAITASVPGTGTGSVSGALSLDDKWHLQRPGLLLLNGIVYSAFGSQNDNGPWHGWILAYNAATLHQTGVYCATPNSAGSGVWMAGSGLSADVVDPVNHPYGRMFVATGNGTYDATPPYTNSMDYGDDHLRLDLTNGVLTVQDSFTPFNQASLNSNDNDTGSGGIVLLPDQTTGGHTHLLAQVGKDGRIFLVDRDTMGGYCSTCTTLDTQIVQELPAAIPNGLWGMPAYWNGNLYFWGNEDTMRAFSFTNGRLSSNPTSTSSETVNFEGSIPTVSADGNTNGIVWNIDSATAHFVLMAHDALDVGTTLYSTTQNSSRDSGSNGVRFSVPTVVNGKVYAGDQYQINVYGLLGGETQAATPVFNPSSESFTGTVSVAISDSTSGASIYYTTNGSTPTTSSTLYSGPISVSASETIEAIATAVNHLQSPVASATYTESSPAAATPTFSPAPGTYTSTQTVTISDATTGAAIYYTTNGTTPTTSSTKYSTPISVGSSETIQAIAVASGYTNSAVGSAAYTISTGSPSINFGSGFTSTSGLQLNGSAIWNSAASRLRLTDSNTAGYETGSTFFTAPVNIQSFTNNFSFQLTSATGDGFTFTIQSSGDTVLGPAGAGLGYGYSGSTAFPNSVAVKFDLYNNAGEGNDSTGMYTDGATPTVPAVDMTSSGVNLHSGDVMNVTMTYNGTTLAWTITDATTGATFSTSATVNIPSLVGGSTAFVGFTGGTGGATAIQEILSWTYTPGSGTTSPAATPTFSPAAGTYTSAQTVTIGDATTGAVIYYTTNGTTPTTSSSKYSTPISVSSTETIQAIAVASGYTNSAVASAAYTINIPQTAATPTFSPAGGSYNSAQSVTISDTTTGAAIYYTTDGTTPTASSTKYSAAISVASSETIQAIAVASGYNNSAIASASYSITIPQASTPTFSPAPGTYTSTQTVTISDATTGAAIYYTTNGTTPTTSSTKYSMPISVSSSETIQAIAVASGYTNSAVGSAAYTISTGSPSINFGSGFTSSTGLTLNGGASIVSNRLRLTDGGATEARSAFFSTPVNIQSFTNNFSFQLTSATGDGFTFTIQGDSSPTWIGAAGGGLGYGAGAPGGIAGIPLSAAVKFDIYNNNGEGSDSTGLYINGASPTIPAIDVTSSGVVLSSGDILNVAMAYDGTTLSWTITDTTTGKSFSTSAAVNLLDIIESPTAYVGFTASTGGSTATQDILSWTFTGTPISGAKMPMRYETESLPGTSSGPSYGVMDWSGFTDGIGTVFGAAAVGDNVTIPINVPAAATYNVRVGVKATNSRGILQLSVNGVNVGSPADEYSSVGYTWEELNLGNVALAAGSQPFKFTVTGKDAASSAYQLTFDFITLIPQ
jgi:Cu/Ag efflux protein CusF